MRVGTRTELGKKYAPLGVRPVGKQRIGYEYLYLYVSIKPFTGEVFAMFLPRLNKECFGIFIRERSQELNARTMMIVDGAGAHRLEEENKLVQLSKLPSYSPELNPVERFFQELRRKLKFRVFETLDQAEKYVTEALKEFLTDPERVKSLTLYPYIRYARCDLI
jgi:transposase